mmetsp:Transcript_52098/g.96461  ORF Transcript_52098/g.96461 Transcript_52098/m.96461 type:complete len:122 (+) Transcript_52098:75-440(+)
MKVTGKPHEPLAECLGSHISPPESVTSTETRLAASRLLIRFSGPSSSTTGAAAAAFPLPGGGFPFFPGDFPPFGEPLPDGGDPLEGGDEGGVEIAAEPRLPDPNCSLTTLPRVMLPEVATD